GEESPQRSAVWLALRQVLERWRQMCRQLMGTTAVSQTDLLLAPVFARVLCAPKYLAGTITLGELTQASAAFVTLQMAFNRLVDTSNGFQTGGPPPIALPPCCWPSIRSRAAMGRPIRRCRRRAERRRCAEKSRPRAELEYVALTLA